MDNYIKLSDAALLLGISEQEILKRVDGDDAVGENITAYVNLTELLANERRRKYFSESQQQKHFPVKDAIQRIRRGEFATKKN